MTRKLFGKTDIFICVALVTIALVIYALNSSTRAGVDNLYAQIILNGDIVKTLPLSVDITFALPQLPDVTFKITNGTAAFIYSDCPDLICIHGGFLHTAGQTAVCMPNRVALVIKTANGFDAIAQ